MVQLYAQFIADFSMKPNEPSAAFIYTYQSELKLVHMLLFHLDLLYDVFKQFKTLFFPSFISFLVSFHKSVCKALYMHNTDTMQH